MLLAATVTEFKEHLETLPGWEYLNNCNSKYSGKQVFVALTERITEKVSGIQLKLTKLKNIKKRKMEKKIDSLTESYFENEAEICELEKKIRSINDYELRHLMSEKKIFENLNHERPSKTFLDIANAVAKCDDICNIRDDNGQAFVDDKAREEYITNFYSLLYRKDEEVEGSVEDFLGEEICEHPLVKNSKLSDLEKLGLDADLTLDELTKVLSESNLRSAPGIDGFSNKFISRFWNILKYPFFKCCCESLADGTLIDSFSTAQIKIIPKKGDTSKIKNWRPISLLSNFYKILSRAINNRLKTVINSVLSRAQKGFTKPRQIQEIIINLDETIHRASKKMSKGP
jgi:hypothetical protein